MPDKSPPGADKPDLESIAKTAETLIQRGAQEVRIRATDEEIEISIKCPLPANRWEALWLAVKTFFGGVRKK